MHYKSPTCDHDSSGELLHVLHFLRAMGYWKSQLLSRHFSAVMALALLSCLAICKGIPIGGRDSISEHEGTDPLEDRGE